MYSINQLSSPPSDLNLKTKASLLVTPWSWPVLLQKGAPCLQYPGYTIGRWFQIVVEQSFHQKETWQSLQLLKLTKDLTCAEQFINLGHETASKPFLLLKVLFLEWYNTVLDMQKKDLLPHLSSSPPIFFPTLFRWDHVLNAWIPKDQSIDWKVEKKDLNFVVWFVVVESTFMSLQSLWRLNLSRNWVILIFSGQKPCTRII